MGGTGLLKGKFPKQTFYSVLYSENKKPDGLVVKVGEGANFKLNPKRRKAAESVTGLKAAIGGGIANAPDA